MEIRTPLTPRVPVKAVLFDFDGTISTLRCGWEKVMGPLFVEILDDGKTDIKEPEKRSTNISMNRQAFRPFFR